MNGEEQNFLPERIDAQIKDLSTSSLSEDEQHLQQELQSAYQPYRQENTQSLRRVWSRLEPMLQEQVSAEEIAAIIPIEEFYRRSSREQTHVMIHTTEIHSTTRHRLWPVLSALAAVAVILVVLGSTMFMFNAAGHNRPTVTGRAGAVQGNAPLVNTPGIYTVTETNDGNATLSRLDLVTHKTLWNYPVPPFTYATVVYGDTLYTNNSNYQVHTPTLTAINATSGTLQWSIDLSSTLRKIFPDYDSALKGTVDSISIPTIANGQLYAMTRSGVLFDINSQTGKVVWTYQADTSSLKELKDYNYAEMTPVVENGVVYDTTRNVIFAVDAKTSKGIWSNTASDQQQIYQSVQSANGVLYISSTSTNKQNRQGYLYAYNAKGGRQIWKDSYNYPITSPIVIDSGRIYFAEPAPAIGAKESHGLYASSGPGRSIIYALGSDGKEVWHKYVANFVNVVALSASNGAVNYAEYQHTVTLAKATAKASMIDSVVAFSLNSSNGQQLWQKVLIQSTANTYGTIMTDMSNNAIFMANFGGHFIVYDLKNKREIWQGFFNDVIPSSNPGGPGMLRLSSLNIVQ